MPRHLVSLGAGIVALVASFALSSGIPGYLGMIALALASVIIGHFAIRRPGPFLWAAIVGLALSYLVLVMAIGLFTVRLLRVFSGMM